MYLFGRLSEMQSIKDLKAPDRKNREEQIVVKDVARDLQSLRLICEHIVQRIIETDLVLVWARPL